MPLLLVRYDYLNVLDGCFRKMKSYILLTITAKVTSGMELFASINNDRIKLNGCFR